MARFKKGTTDHDGDGEKGGGLPAKLTLEERVERLERLIALADPVAAASSLKD